MKLKYRIAKTTELNSEMMIKRILSKILEKKYGVVNVTDRSVSFDDHSGGFIGSWEYMHRMHSGNFEVVHNKKNNIVVFEFYPIAVFEFVYVALICGVFIVLGIINNFYFSGVISLAFFCRLVFKYYHLKRIADKMLTEIVI